MSRRAAFGHFIMLFVLQSHWVEASGLNSVPGSRYLSAAAASMGDAYLPIGEDGPTALFNNPATVSRINGFQAELINWQLGTNTDAIQNFNSDFYKIYSLPKYAPRLAAAKGRRPGINGAYVPTFAIPGVALGAMLNGDWIATDTEINIRYRTLYQFIPALALGFGLARGIVRMGYSGQWVHQASGEVTTEYNKINGYNSGLSSGSGFSHNFGFALTLPYRFFPAFNFVARNIAGMKYRSTNFLRNVENRAGNPPNEDMTLDSSFSIQPRFKGKGHFFLVAEGKDLTNRSSTSILIRTSLGIEWSIKDILFLRTGFGNGYPSGGIGIGGEKAEFAFAWYTRELGRKFHEHKDTRYMFQFKSRF